MQLFHSQKIAQRQKTLLNARLQQAIHLLTMGNVDLASYIEEQSTENPFLDISYYIPKRDNFGASQASKGTGHDWDRIANLVAGEGKSFYVHVTHEITRLELTPQEHLAASHFVDALEPSGWLGQSLSSIAFSAGISTDEADKVLLKLQKIEPAGIFARSLAECLRLQALERGILTARFDMILKNLPMLGDADLQGLARLCDCSMQGLRTDLCQLRSLNPKPGAIFETFIPPQRPPDLIISKAENGNGWRVDLNCSTLPSVIVQSDVAKTLSQHDTPKTRAATDEHPAHRIFIEEKVASARWLARAIEQRNHTILKIGIDIARRQSEFLNRGIAALKPMVLRDVADAVGVHESTVSRVSSGMLVLTPQGSFPLKSFFSTALPMNGGKGGAGSSAAVRYRISQLIQVENKTRPLSDGDIAKAISDEGVVIARRTVAKYRDILAIPPSSARKRRARLDMNGFGALVN